MKIYIDSANLKAIESILNHYVVYGVTTNPSLLARETKNPLETLRSIKALIGEDLQLHAQVLSTTAEAMFQEGIHLCERLGDTTFIKVPVTEQGIKAMQLLHKQGVNITATAIYTPMQALLAAQSGAQFTAPYVNRLDMIGADGVQVAITIQTLLTQYHLPTQLLAASFKNVEQIFRIALAGGDTITASPDIIRQLLCHPLTDQAVSDFISDFESITHKGGTFLDF